MQPKTKHTVLQTRGLSVGYFNKKGSAALCNNVDISFKKGECTGLVGANGTGKSTLIRTLAAMQKPLRGSILIEGKKIETLSPLHRATKISVVLTEVPASKNLSVFELIALGRQPYTNWLGKLSETDMQTVNAAMAETETTNLAGKKCSELSDGQLQRVYIARALAQGTPIIILDEPTTHLDLYHRAYIFKLLKRLAQQHGKTILFSTHEIEPALRLCDKMILMVQGELYFDTPSKLIAAGRFDRLFPSGAVQFDAGSGRFLIGG
ncbi:MAG: ABC transporter ATP-binding protein [Marinirhabdus sp.]